MTAYLLAAFGAALMMAAVSFFAWKRARSKLSEERMKTAFLSRKVEQVESENEKLRREIEIKSKWEKEAYEKIDSLHTGDSVSNALSELSK